MTKAQQAALQWLNRHNGDGCFDRNGVLLAAGESAPHERKTWNVLRDLGLVEIYDLHTKRKRLRITPAGQQAAQ
jgi:hypothetical protein